MNKKIISPILFAGLILTTLSFIKPANASSNSDASCFDLDTIRALSHCEGTTVDFLSPDMKAYWNSNATDLTNLKSLYEYNDEIATFAENAYDHEYTRNLYAKWDDFKPVNNTLAWECSFKADSYDVVVSLDAELTKSVADVAGIKDCKYTIESPLANTHYFWQVTAHKGNEKIKSSIFDFYSSDYKRTLDIPSVSNTRDVGGFTGKYGTMKQGLIYRSGRLDDIDQTGKDTLAKLSIQTDLDVRSKGEGLVNPGQLPNYLRKTLLSYSQDFAEVNRPNTIEAVRVFANKENYPIIFHCAVGRDRTGTLAIILQALAGASKEYIIHDYYSSMWSVTGAYQKTLEGMNLTAVQGVLSILEGLGTTINDGAENFLKQRVDTNTNQLVGLTTEEINAIRDIWSGKVEAPNAFKPFMAQENYNGKAFVKIETFGKKDICKMVDKGTILNSPFELTDSLAYYSNGALFDFSKPIQETTFIYTDYLSQYIVTIHFAGLARRDEILKVNYGVVITFDSYAISEYKMLVLSLTGKEISKLTVTTDSLVNIIYYK